MSFVRISLTIVSIVAILQPALVHSLPQVVLDSEDTSSYDLGNLPSVPAESFENTAPFIDTDPLDTYDDGSNLFAALPPDSTSSDSTDAANPDPSSSNEEDFLIAGNTRHRGTNCPNNKGEGSCPLRVAPTDSDPTRPGSQGSREGSTKPKTGNQFEPYKVGAPEPEDGKICPEPWDHHLCGLGPESDIGRVDIPGYYHRTLIVNLDRTC